MDNKCSSKNVHAVVVLIASFLAHALFCTVMDSGGVFHVLFLQAFGGGSGDTAFISSLNTAMFYGAGPFSGYLTQRIGFRAAAVMGATIGSLGVIASAFVSSLPMAYFTFGFLGGFGLGLAYIPSISIVGFYFTKCRPVAYAIASSGCGVGKLVAPYIMQYCEEKYGWRGAICIIGAIALNITVCGTVYREPQTTVDVSDVSSESSAEDIPSNNNNEKNRLCKDSTIFRDWKFRCFAVNNFLFCAGYATALVHLPAYAQTLGISEQHRSIFFSLFGPASLIGKVSFGLIGQIKGIRHCVVYMTFFFVVGLQMTLAPFYLKTFADFVIFAITFGIFMSTFGATTPSIMVDFYGVASCAAAIAYLNLFGMMGFMMGPPLAGWLYDWTCHYPSSIYFGGTAILLSAITVIPPVFSYKYQKSDRHKKDLISSSETPEVEIATEAKEINTKLIFIDENGDRYPNHGPGVAL